MAVTDLHFTGSVSARVINLFRSAIEAGINDAVSSETICPQIKANVDPLMTDYIHRGVAYIERYLPKEGRNEINTRSARVLQPSRSLSTHGLHSDSNADAIDFHRDLPVLTDLLTNANKFVGQHLNQGLLPNMTVCDGGFSRGVNGVMRNMVPYIQIAAPLQFQIHHLLNDATVTLHLDHWKTAGEGLHQWENLTVLTPNGDSSFSSHVKTTDLDISVETSITVDIPSSEPLFESFQVNLNLSSIELSTDVFVELNRLLFQNVTAGDVITALKHIGTWTPAVACLVKPVSKLYLKSLTTATTISSLQLHAENSKDDRLEEDVDVLINNLVGFVLDQYDTLVSEAIAGLSQGPVLDEINSFLDEQIKDMSENCSHTGDSSSSDVAWIDFTQIEVLDRLNGFLHEPETIHHLNGYIDCATSVIGQLALEKLSSLSSLVEFDDIQLEHFGSVQALFLLLPTNVTTLESAFSIGEVSKQPQLTVRARVPAFDGDISLSISLSNLTWASTVMILYDQAVMDLSPMVELLSKGQCTLAPIHEFDFTYFDGSFGRLNINSTASANVHNKTYAVNFASADFPEIQDFAWTIFEWSISTVQRTLTTISQTTVNSAYRTCAPTSEPNRESKSNSNDRKLSAHSLWVILGTLFVLAQPLILLFRRDYNRNEETANLSALAEPLLQDSSSRSQEEPHISQEPASSLMQDFNGHSVHYVLPVMILFTAVLFIASNTSVGATVDLSLSLPAQTFKIPGVYSFGLIDTAKNMLNAGIYPLFMLVVVFSGIWPYAKLVLMFSAWVAPDKVLSVKGRENLLRTLDSCSKYSLVDTYVFIGMYKCFSLLCNLIGIAHSHACCISLSCGVG